MTRRVALIGKPLRRRHSVVMHNAAFAAAGIDAEYVLAEVDADAVPRVVAEARGPEWLGLGVTAPYKVVVADLVDTVEPVARTVGAVNNVVRTNHGRLIGFNTDAPGFMTAVQAAMGRSVAGAEVVVVGAGGVARAIVTALVLADAGRITVANRTPERAHELLAHVEWLGQATRAATGLGDSSFHDALRTADLAVNATSVGMIDAGMTIPVESLPDHANVFDVVYVPAETPLVAAARARGLQAENGSEMLIQQAAIAFERWTGVGGMADVMRESVAPLLADPGAIA